MVLLEHRRVPGGPLNFFLIREKHLVVLLEHRRVPEGPLNFFLIRHFFSGPLGTPYRVRSIYFVNQIPGRARRAPLS